MVDLYEPTNNRYRHGESLLDLDLSVVVWFALQLAFLSQDQVARGASLTPRRGRHHREQKGRETEEDSVCSPGIAGTPKKLKMRKL